MLIDILTLFPEMFAPLDYSIVKRAKDKGLLEINLVNIRDFATDKHRSVDDHPYGGGAGMILRVDITDKALSTLKSQFEISNLNSNSNDKKTIFKPKVILLDAGGKMFDQGLARDLSHDEHLILICGHYEGVDHRVIEHLCDEVISVGDYVLSGGELPAMTIVDSVVRLIPGVLGNSKSLDEESFNDVPPSPQGLRRAGEYPQYTRPVEYKGWKVPEVLLTGDHKKIKGWRSESAKLH